MSLCLPPPALQTEYRNKCEFLVGVGVDGEDNTVGCRLGKYKGGTCAVAAPLIPCTSLRPPSRW